MPLIPSICNVCQTPIWTTDDMCSPLTQRVGGCIDGSCCCCGAEVSVLDDLYGVVDAACGACFSDCTTPAEIRCVADMFQCEETQEPSQLAQLIEPVAPSVSPIVARLPADPAECEPYFSALYSTLCGQADLVQSYHPQAWSEHLTDQAIEKSCVVCDPGAPEAGAWVMAPTSMPPNVSEAQSLLLGSGASQAHLRFVLYCHDVQAAIFAFVACRGSRSGPEADFPEILYHASCFVCAARRVARFLESVPRNRNDFDPSIADVIQLEWKKKYAFYSKVRVVRNAIEHIDDVACNETRWQFYCFDNDTFIVTDERALVINDAALCNVVSSCGAISNTIVDAYASEHAGAHVDQGNY